MKKLLITSFLILLVTSLLSIVSIAAIVEFEDDYVTGDEIVLASFHGVKPFIADSANPEPLEDACYWLGDMKDKFNLQYVSFVGSMSSKANYLHADYVSKQGHTLQELYDANLSDEEWQADFQLLKDTASILTDATIPYGVSIGINDYPADGMTRPNLLALTITPSDSVGDADVDMIVYDSNNFAVIKRVGMTSYIIYQLELFPQIKTIEWFNTIQAEHSDKRAIIYTTSFTDKDGAMFTQHDWSANGGKLASNYRSFSSTCKTNMLNAGQPHDGTELWDNAFSIHDNILCIVSANASVSNNIVVSKFTNPNGYEVVSVLANLDGGYGSSGKAYPVLIKLSEDNKTLDIRYAVPYYNKLGGYVKESQQVVTVNKVLDLPDPDPVTLLPKVELQSNGNNVAYINGYEGNLFKPNNNMSKAEACTIFARLLTETQNIPDGYTTRFTDVKEGDWYYNAIAYLDQTGYFYTTEGDKYNPNAKITRAEFVELAYFASNIKAENNISFTDVTEDNKYYDAIMAAAASGLVNGYGDNTFKPDATITRAEVVTVINRLLSLIANERTVTTKGLDKVFNDISGHWAEYNILLASNDNVPTVSASTLNPNALSSNSKSIIIENDHVKISIAKKGGNVTEIINKATGENVVAKSTTPYFTYATESTGSAVAPNTLEIVDGRLKVTYKNKLVAHFIVDVKPNYFTITLDTNLPSSVAGIVMCQLNVNSDWELDNPNAFGISAVPMTTTVDIGYNPGGASKIAKAMTYSFLDTYTICSKVGVAFSRMTEHRDHLKEITDEIDRRYGVASKHGGAYGLDNPDIYNDYVILSSGLTPQTALETAELCEKYSVEEVNIHQGGSTFIQGDFNFVCARTETEKKTGKFIDAATFKERIGDVLLEHGVMPKMHTYSSLVFAGANSLLSVPQYQQDIAKAPETWTVRGKLSKARTNIKTYEDASNFKHSGVNIPYSGDPRTKFILIDEEIILVQQGTSSGFLNVTRGMYGTTKADHADGAKIYQLLGWYNGFQPKPLSSLFYKVAELTAKSLNEGGMNALYLDGFESFARAAFMDTKESYYAYTEFLRTILLNCESDPLIEMSTYQPSFWAARARGGAIDHPRRAYKKNMKIHLTNQSKYHNYFYTATAGWFNYCPDKDDQFKDTGIRTLHRDDMEFFGSLCIAYNFGTVCQPFSIAAFEEKTKLADNFYYYGLYTKLRESNYFSPEVKQAIIDGEYEYKLFKQEDGSWAFKEMQYFKHKIYDAAEPKFITGSGENPFNAQTPFIRIEQRYSTKGEENDAVLVYDFDENKAISELNGKYKINPTVDASGKITFKVRVYGNGTTTDALLISLGGVDKSDHSGRYDYFIPLNFTGWKEIIIAEANNEDFDGYTFPGITIGGTAYNVSYRPKVDYAKLDEIWVSYAGTCAGAKLDTIKAYTPVDTPVKNPSVTIGGETITFNTELHSSEYIEYYPEFGKAYLNSYTQIYNEDGSWKDDEAHTQEISFTGNVTVPKGKFNYTYNAEALTDAPVRAQVVIGLSGAVLENPADWVEPEVDIPENIEKPALY